MKRRTGWRETTPEQTETAFMAIAALPNGARLDGRYLAGGYWMATWAENYGEARGMLILTPSWDHYRQTIHRALTVLNGSRRKPAASELAPSMLRTSASA